jgi:ABC-type nickel/cobalt efflux system permease component RcnA
MPKQHHQKNACGNAHAQTEGRILHVEKELVES